MGNLYFILTLFNEKLYNLTEEGFFVEKYNDYAIITQNPKQEKGNSFSKLTDFFPNLNVNQWAIILICETMPNFNRFIYKTLSKKSTDFKDINSLLKQLNFKLSSEELYEQISKKH